MTGVYIPRKLAERANIILEFPTSNGNTIKAYIPILENPDISENQRARLTQHSILARAGNMFTYTGADSRSITLRFNITLLNLLGYIHEESLVDKFSRQFRLFYFNKDQQKRVFTSGPASTNTTQMDKAGLAKKYYESMVGSPSMFSNAIFDSVTNFIFGDLISDSQSTNTNNKTNNAINLYLLWINLIRSTVLNNSSNTSYGPPVIRLNYGTMYNNVPFVCNDYNIKINTAAGYDIPTLTPKQVEISLNLSENRIGDFNKFESRQVITGDNVVGWEGVIESDTLDPYNDDWSSQSITESKAYQDYKKASVIVAQSFL